MLAAFTLQLHVYFQADHYRNAENDFEFFGLPIVHKKIVALPVSTLNLTCMLPCQNLCCPNTIAAPGKR